MTNVSRSPELHLPVNHQLLRNVITFVVTGCDQKLKKIWRPNEQYQWRPFILSPQYVVSLGLLKILTLVIYLRIYIKNVPSLACGYLSISKTKWMTNIKSIVKNERFCILFLMSLDWKKIQEILAILSLEWWFWWRWCHHCGDNGVSTQAVVMIVSAQCWYWWW